jgi:hypothetical protein
MPQKPVNLPSILKAAGVGSQLELLLLNRLERAGLPVGTAQVLGIPGRKFAFDRAWPDAVPPVAVNVQGATFVKGGHSTGRGIERDCEVACLATLAGWRYLPLTKHMIQDGRAVDFIHRALHGDDCGGGHGVGS